MAQNLVASRFRVQRQAHSSVPFVPPCTDRKVISWPTSLTQMFSVNALLVRIKNIDFIALPTFFSKAYPVNLHAVICWPRREIEHCSPRLVVGCVMGSTLQVFPARSRQVQRLSSDEKSVPEETVISLKVSPFTLTAKGVALSKEKACTMMLSPNRRAGQFLVLRVSVDSFTLLQIFFLWREFMRLGPIYEGTTNHLAIPMHSDSTGPKILRFPGSLSLSLLLHFQLLHLVGNLLQLLVHSSQVARHSRHLFLNFSP